MRENSLKGEKTLLASLLLSAPGPIVTGISVLLSFSTTQIADFLRRTTELVAIAVSWWVYRKLGQSVEIDDTGKTRMERMAKRFTSGAMICSGVMLFIITVLQMHSYRPGGNVTMGLVIAALGVLVNSWFWLRYRSLNREKYDAVIAVQQKLYRAKSFADVCVVIALATVAMAPGHPVTRYVDILGSIIITCYLLWSGLQK
ncbi:MAG: cation transporter [Clostridiaceae bacterium]|jgi:divalent metal cation (Fe/Co/Zn/Cd) transporter|nr:cation transporter [Clostridiaceae bacterium]